jgi:antitoxin ParD1/3/4
MIMPRTTSIVLGDHFDQFLNEQIEKGRFQSADEAIRAGLRRIEEEDLKLENLRRSLIEGLESPAVPNFSQESFIREMHVKYKVDN